MRIIFDDIKVFLKTLSFSQKITLAMLVFVGVVTPIATVISLQPKKIRSHAAEPVITPYGNALQFHETALYTKSATAVEISTVKNKEQWNDTFSIELWVKPEYTQTTSDKQYIFFAPIQEDTDYHTLAGPGVYIANHNIVAEYVTTLHKGTIDGGYISNGWHHVVFFSWNNNCYLYVDGVQRGAKTSNECDNGYNNPLYFTENMTIGAQVGYYLNAGKYYRGRFSPFVGQIDEIRIQGPSYYDLNVPIPNAPFPANSGLWQYRFDELTSGTFAPYGIRAVYGTIYGSQYGLVTSTVPYFAPTPTEVPTLTPTTIPTETPSPTPTPPGYCINGCGNGICEEVSCTAEGCTCPESPETCPSDCPAPTFTPTPTNTPTPSPTLTPIPTLTPTPTNTPTPIPTNTPTPKPSTINIYAYGTASSGIYPTMELRLNDVVLKSWTNIKKSATGGFVKYSYNFTRKLTNSDKIKIAYINNDQISGTSGRNLRVDKIIVDGKTYQTESSNVYSTGTWSSSSNKCTSRYPQSEWLHCNGYFLYLIQ